MTFLYRHRRGFCAFTTVSAAIAALLALSACSDEGRTVPGGGRFGASTPLSNQEPATQDMVRAAKALSLTHAGALTSNSEYTQAIDCAAALEALQEVMQGKSLSDREASALRQAAVQFRARASGLLEAENKTSALLDAEIQRRRTDMNIDRNQAVQTSLACIRTLPQ